MSLNAAQGHRFQELITPAEAENIISAALPRYSEVTLPLSKCQGHILREPIRADRAQPPFDRVAMDGIAFSYSAWEKGQRRFAIQGIQKAGDKPKRLTDASKCFEVMTGAVLPVDADCIAPVETIDVDDGFAIIREPVDKDSFTAYRYVHRAGGDCRSGEIIVPAGTLLCAPHIGAAAAFGMVELRVAASPAIAIVATGDELVDPRRRPLGHQIRRSNPSAIEAALKKRHINRVALLHCGDDRERLRKCLERVKKKCDILILTGGVSMGKTDYVPEVLRDLGVQTLFHKILQKPGKPFWFGVGADGWPVFALPGNPASALVCLHRYVLPAMAKAATGTLEIGWNVIPVVLEQGVNRGKLTQFQPVTVAWGSDGRLRESLTGNQGSGDFSAWAKADGFVEIASGTGEAEAGSLQMFWRW